MYNQELGDAPRSPTVSGRISNDSRGMDETQEAWNHCNNVATVTGQLPPSDFAPQGPEESQREDGSLSHCPVRVANSAPGGGHCPVRLPSGDHCSASVIGHSMQGGCNANETLANGSYSGPAWSGGNRMHLVSDVFNS